MLSLYKDQACCFTGYRPEKFPFPFDELNIQYKKFEDKLLDAIFKLASDGVTTFYTGMARGFDLIAAEITLLYREMKPGTIKLHCAIPFEGQEAGWPAGWQSRYYDILRRADESVTLLGGYHRSCYQRRNEYMVKRSQVVLTYFDGRKGGTANTLAYASRKGLEIFNLSETEIRDYTLGCEAGYFFDDEMPL